MSTPIILLIALVLFLVYKGYRSQRKETEALVARCHAINLVQQAIDVLKDIDYQDAQDRRTFLEERLEVIQREPNNEDLWHDQALMDAITEAHALVLEYKSQQKTIAKMKEKIQATDF